MHISMQKKNEKLVQALDQEREILLNKIGAMSEKDLTRVTLMLIIFPDIIISFSWNFITVLPSLGQGSRIERKIENT
jgi:hypothetical protein